MGAIYLGDRRCRFRVWAPLAQKMEVRILTPQERVEPLHPEGAYHQAVVEGVQPGCRYFFRLDRRRERPDPASRFQPEGVHGPSEVVDHEFPWEDAGWFGLPLRDYVLYELHVGTFTREGTFEAVIRHLDELRDLGITAVELMPVAQFPGGRNWGYDGASLFAVQNSYGGPRGLKKLVNACHQRGMAVVLDVVYNHMGPEGNYLADFGPYFTNRYQTQWGQALNFDGPDSGAVRRFFVENALYWVSRFHVDALRLDAVHAILDFSALPFLEELSMAAQERAERLNRRVHLIAESDLNDTRLVRSRELGGFGLDAQWLDDFHHAVHGLLTGEKDGYYEDFGGLSHLEKALRDGFVYAGDFSVHRRRPHGRSSRGIPPGRFVAFTQNHDQIGNRMAGDRLSTLLSFEAEKLAAGVLILSPFIPLLFMGQEYGETAPFPYFVSHSDRDLVEAVRQGRRREFAGFRWAGEPPDPQDETTFLSAKLNRDLCRSGRHRVLLDLHRELFRLRRSLAPLGPCSPEEMEVFRSEQHRLLCLRRWKGNEQALAAFHFGDRPESIELPMPPGRWQKRFDSEDAQWGGRGSDAPGRLESGGRLTLKLHPKAFLLFTRESDA
ncbi:MAG: malto-oligosyltrehalose trehalohydrolase [bacterium]